MKKILLGREIKLFGREIWLSPVIQATWEARAVGWFEVERLPQENRRAFGTALWLPASRYRHDDARGSMTKQACKKPSLQHSCMDVVRVSSAQSNKPDPALVM
jgi:hypothetical protein